MFRKRFAHPLGAAAGALALLFVLMATLVTAHAQPAKRPGRHGHSASMSIPSRWPMPLSPSRVEARRRPPPTDGSFKLAGVATGNVILEVTADGSPASKFRCSARPPRCSSAS